MGLRVRFTRCTAARPPPRAGVPHLSGAPGPVGGPARPRPKVPSVSRRRIPPAHPRPRARRLLAPIASLTACAAAATALIAATAAIAPSAAAADQRPDIHHTRPTLPIPTHADRRFHPDDGDELRGAADLRAARVEIGDRCASERLGRRERRRADGAALEFPPAVAALAAAAVHRRQVRPGRPRPGEGRGPRTAAGQRRIDRPGLHELAAARLGRPGRDAPAAARRRGPGHPHTHPPRRLAVGEPLDGRELGRPVRLRAAGCGRGQRFPARRLRVDQRGRGLGIDAGRDRDADRHLLLDQLELPAGRREFAEVRQRGDQHPAERDEDLAAAGRDARRRGSAGAGRGLPAGNAGAHPRQPASPQAALPQHTRAFAPLGPSAAAAA